MTSLALGEWPEQRVGLFVDTQNLYYTAREHYRRQVDYERLLHVAARGRRLMQATAYVVEREGEATAFAFVTKLSVLGYRVRRKTTRLYQGADSSRLLNGDWDMGIAADIVRALDHLDVIVLASGDGDFVPLMELVQERGRRTEVIAFRETASQALLDIVDRFQHIPDLNSMLAAAS